MKRRISIAIAALAMCSVSSSANANTWWSVRPGQTWCRITIGIPAPHPLQAFVPCFSGAFL
jgi:hypothetical protein